MCASVGTSLQIVCTYEILVAWMAWRNVYGFCYEQILMFALSDPFDIFPRCSSCSAQRIQFNFRGYNFLNL